MARDNKKDESPSTKSNSGNDEPEWRPYNHEDFSKGTHNIAEMYKSDPDRVYGLDDNGNNDEPANNN